MSRWLMLLPLVIVLIAACGGDDDAPTRTTNSTTDPTSTGASGQATATPAAPESTPTSAPTVTEAASPTPAATATPVATSTPAPTATPEASPPDIQVVQWTRVMASYGTAVYVMGYVQNHGETAAQDVQVVVSLRDAAGSIIGSTDSQVPAVVTAGAQAPFRATITDIDPAAVASVDLLTQFEPFDPDDFVAGYWITDIEIVQANWTGSSWAGEIRNVGDVGTQLVAVYLCALDAGGAVIWCDYSYADLDEIAPGATSPYTVSITQDGLPTPASSIAYAIGTET